MYRQHHNLPPGLKPGDKLVLLVEDDVYGRAGKTWDVVEFPYDNKVLNITDGIVTYKGDGLSPSKWKVIKGPNRRKGYARWVHEHLCL